MPNAKRIQYHSYGGPELMHLEDDANTLNGRFDLVFDTAGTLPIKTARTLLKPGGTGRTIEGSRGNAHKACLWPTDAPPEAGQAPPSPSGGERGALFAASRFSS
jgi:hypothetical protein